MNTAMQDAFNLAWKLAAAVQGEGGQCGAANAPHTILTIAAEIPAPAAGPAGQGQVLIAADDTPVGGYDQVSADQTGWRPSVSACGTAVACWCGPTAISVRSSRSTTSMQRPTTSPRSPGKAVYTYEIDAQARFDERPTAFR